MPRKTKIKINSNRSFGLVFFVLFLIIAFWSFKGELNQIKIFPLIISFIFLVLGIINSNILTPLNKLWFKFGLMLGRLISPVIMASIFFLIVTPIGLIMKVARKDSMGKKYNKKAKSYWLKRQYPISTMKRQF